MGKKAKKRILTVLGLAALFVGVVCGVYFSVKADAVERPGHLYIRQGSTYADLLDSLDNGSVRLKNIRRFDRVARAMKNGQTVRPGHYHIRQGMNYLQLARTLQRGLQTPVRLTFNNVRLVPQLAGKISKQLEADSLTLVRMLSNDTIPDHYGFRKEEFIGMFIPNTYEMYWTVTPTALLDRMKREYDAFWTAGRDQKRQRTGLSRNGIVTLASIVYEETQRTDEMTRMAGVYLNRLRAGMFLQADPTLKFAVGDFAIRRVLDVHKETDSPYNTYKYAGLPPGPICMPSVKAIDAVLEYEEHDYYYFCAKEDFSGYHRFSRSLAEHSQNAARYHAALNRLGVR